MLAEGRDSLLRKSGSGLLESLETGLKRDEVELETEGRGKGFEETTTGWDDLLADAVTGDKAWRERVRVVARKLF